MDQCHEGGALMAPRTRAAAGGELGMVMVVVVVVGVPGSIWAVIHLSVWMVRSRRVG